MQNSLKILALGAAFAASTTLAHAATILGFSQGTQSPITYTAGSGPTYTITVSANPVVNGANGTGGTEELNGDVTAYSTVTFIGGTYTYTIGSSFAPEAILTFVDKGVTITDYVTSVQVVDATEIYLQGYLSGGQYGTATADTLDLSTLNQSSTFQGSLIVPPISATPEPSSLVLLGTGLVSAAGMLVRRRRLVA